MTVLLNAICRRHFRRCCCLVQNASTRGVAVWCVSCCSVGCGLRACCLVVTWWFVYSCCSVWAESGQIGGRSRPVRRLTSAVNVKLLTHTSRGVTEVCLNSQVRGHISVENLHIVF